MYRNTENDGPKWIKWILNGKCQTKHFYRQESQHTTFNINILISFLEQQQQQLAS